MRKNTQPWRGNRAVVGGRESQTLSYRAATRPASFFANMPRLVIDRCDAPLADLKAVLYTPNLPEAPS